MTSSVWLMSGVRRTAHVTFSDFPVRNPAGVGGFRVTCLNFERSRVGVLSMFHVAVTVAVGNLKKGCRLSRFHIKCHRYFLGYVACRNSPWQTSGKVLLMCGERRTTHKPVVLA